MKNRFLKTISGAALAMLTLAISAQVWVSAQDNSSEQQINEQTQKAPLEAQNNGAELEGSWDVQATFRSCRNGTALGPPFPSMSTFMQGGTLQEFGVASGLFRGPGHGIWRQQSGQNYSAVFQFFRFNPDGTFASKVIVRRQIQVSGDVFTGSSRVEFLDVNGNLTGTGCVTETATRLRFDN